MANNNLPNITSELTDGNLNTQQTVDLGDSILVIGTAPFGPVNQPVSITDPTNAASIWGPITQGTLVRGIAEVFHGPNGKKDIRGCRISSGKTAVVDILETQGNGVYGPSYVNESAVSALTLEALYPGSIYNSISIQQATVNGQLSVVMTNPVTGINSVYAYDPTGLNASAVSDVLTLANTINGDANLNGYISATANNINISYRFQPSGIPSADRDKIITSLHGTTSVNLAELLKADDLNDDGYTDGSSWLYPSGIPVTAGNRLVALSEVYELADEAVELASAGYLSMVLPDPVQAHDSGISLPFLDCDTLLPSGYGTARHIITNSMIGTADGTETAFKFTAYEAIDPTTLKVYRTSAAGTTVPVTSYTLVSAGGSGSTVPYVAEIDFTPAPLTGSIITVSYTSLAFTLTQAATLQACQLSSSYATYFAAGNTITFGTVQPSDIKLGYAAKKLYAIGTAAVISDAKNGTVLFSDTDSQPDLTSSETWIGLSYTYQPEWIDISTGGAKSLQGGTDGIVMSNNDKYTLLGNLYTAIADYYVDSVVLMGTYLDDTMIQYDPESGLPVEVNAGFGNQFNTYLQGLQDGVNEVYGIMAVKPAASASLSGINTWFNNLTIQSSLNKTVAANVMATANWKNISVVTFEPVVTIPEIAVPYITTGEAIYAGLLCKLPLTSATTFKNLGPQVAGCRYKLSSRQLNTLTGLRYVSARLLSDGTWVITDGVTAEYVGGDYTRMTTVKIVFASMDVVRKSGQPFMGELFNPAKKAALETAINKGLLAMQEGGILKKYTFKINQTAAQATAGVATVPLVLWPEFELRRIEVTVQLSNQ